MYNKVLFTRFKYFNLVAVQNETLEKIKKIKHVFQILFTVK